MSDPNGSFSRIQPHQIYGKSMVEIASLGDHIRGCQQNLDGPLPIYVGKIDTAFSRMLASLDFAKDLRSIQTMNTGFSSFRAAIVLAQAGACSQVPLLLRHSLECAMYAYLFSRDAKYSGYWKRREESKTARDNFRKGTVPRFKELLAEEHPRYFEGVTELYETLIALGGHPNVIQIASAVKYEFEDGAPTGMYWHTVLADQDARDQAYQEISVTAINCLHLASLVWPERFNIMMIHELLYDAVRLMPEDAFPEQNP